jgi:hypothetical protein
MKWSRFGSGFFMNRPFHFDCGEILNETRPLYIVRQVTALPVVTRAATPATFVEGAS